MTHNWSDLMSDFIRDVRSEFNDTPAPATCNHAWVPWPGYGKPGEASICQKCRAEWVPSAPTSERAECHLLLDRIPDIGMDDVRGALNELVAHYAPKP